MTRPMESAVWQRRRGAPSEGRDEVVGWLVVFPVMSQRRRADGRAHGRADVGERASLRREKAAFGATEKTAGSNSPGIPRKVRQALRSLITVTGETAPVAGLGRGGKGGRRAGSGALPGEEAVARAGPENRPVGAARRPQ